MSETKRTPTEVLRDISPHLSDGLRQYVEGAVNARPKVEEIISLIERLNAHFDSGLYYLTETEWNFLHAKAREVEAALGGKAE